jgi:hypothetical protein
MHCVYRGARLVFTADNYRQIQRYLSRHHGCYYKFMEK